MHGILYHGRRNTKISLGDHMDEYSVWIDETGKIVSFHEIDNGELIYFDQREIYLAYLSALTTQGYRFQ